MYLHSAHTAVRTELERVLRKAQRGQPPIVLTALKAYIPTIRDDTVIVQPKRAARAVTSESGI